MWLQGESLPSLTPTKRPWTNAWKMKSPLGMAHLQGLCHMFVSGRVFHNLVKYEENDRQYTKWSSLLANNRMAKYDQKPIQFIVLPQNLLPQKISFQKKHTHTHKDTPQHVTCNTTSTRYPTTRVVFKKMVELFPLDLLQVGSKLVLSWEWFTSCWFQPTHLKHMI